MSVSLGSRAVDADAGEEEQPAVVAYPAMIDDREVAGLRPQTLLAVLAVALVRSTRERDTKLNAQARGGATTTTNPARINTITRSSLS
jgi:hypothetical protein